MKRILEYYDHVESTCSFWRGRGVLSELERTGDVKLTLADYNSDTWRKIRMNDIAFFQRPVTKMCTPYIFMCKDMGLKIWIDLDDWFEIPEEHPVYDVYINQVDTKNLKQSLLLADVITVTNQIIANKYIEFEPRIKDKVEIIPNALNDHLYAVKPFNGNKTILWRGGDHHDYDIKEYIDDIKNVLTKNKDWTFFSIGSELKQLSLLPNYNHITNKNGGKFNIHNYFGILGSLQPGIIISPLRYNDLNKCKSSIAWVEATYAGGVAIMPIWSDHGNAFVFENDFDYVLDHVMNGFYRDEVYSESVDIINKEYKLSITNQKRKEICERL